MTIALIDADILVYSAASVGARTGTIDWDDDGTGGGAELDLGEAINSVETQVEAIRQLTRAKRVRMAFTDRSRRQSSFRYKVHPHYKANRPGQKPDLWQPVFDYMKETWAHTEIPYLEGDDVIGLYLTSPDGGRYVSASLDKDMLTIPGQHLIKGEVVTIDKVAANRAWMLQTLMGDSTDNYKGAPMIGVKKATSALEGLTRLQDLWSAVVSVYETQHDRYRDRFVKWNPIDEAVLNARCARILRFGDHCTAKGVRLWTPDGTEEWLNINTRE